MKKYKSIKIEFLDNKITGYSPTSEKPDFETIFPWFQPPQELFDKYGNYQHEVDVTVKEVSDDAGKQTVTECKPILKPLPPTEEQKTAYYKTQVKQRIKDRYSIDDEIAIAYRGTDAEKKQHEDFVRNVKEKVRAEIDKDLI